MEWYRRILRHDSFVDSNTECFDHGDENSLYMTGTRFYGDKPVRTFPYHCSFFFGMFPRTGDTRPFYHGPRAEGGSMYGRMGPILILLRPQGPSMAPKKHWDTRPELNGPQKAGSGRRPPSRRPLDALKRGKSEKGGLEPAASPAPSTAPPAPRAATGSARTAPPDPRGPHSARRDKPCSGAA